MLLSLRCGIFEKYSILLVAWQRRGVDACNNEKMELKILTDLENGGLIRKIIETDYLINKDACMDILAHKSPTTSSHHV